MAPPKILVITTETRHGLGVGHAFQWFEKSAPAGTVFTYSTRDCPGGGFSHVIILGPSAYYSLYPNAGSIDKARGTFIKRADGIPCTVTYHPQDADDGSGGWQSEDAEQLEGEKDITITSPQNYRFWIRQDLHKLLTRPYREHTPHIIPAPPLQRAIDALNAARNARITIDIECRISDNTLNCIGFKVDDGPVYVVPVYDYRNKLFYGDFHRFYRALALAIGDARRQNTIIAHNAMFDLFILAWKYRIPVGPAVYDTMLAHHRCFPEAEKSLAHAISLWTWLPYHKDMGIEEPKNSNQQWQLWQYNGLDVYATWEVYKTQVNEVKDPGLADSIRQAMDSIHPYLCAMLAGIAYDEAKLIKHTVYLTRWLKQYARIGRILSGVPDFNLNSAQQAVKYFHDRLGYDVVRRTAGGRPSLGYSELLELKLKYPNPLIDVILAARAKQKELSMLEFIPIERKQLK